MGRDCIQPSHPPGEPVPIPSRHIPYCNPFKERPGPMVSQNKKERPSYSQKLSCSGLLHRSKWCGDTSLDLQLFPMKLGNKGGGEVGLWLAPAGFPARAVAPPKLQHWSRSTYGTWPLHKRHEKTIQLLACIWVHTFGVHVLVLSLPLRLKRRAIEIALITPSPCIRWVCGGREKKNPSLFSTY